MHVTNSGWETSSGSNYMTLGTGLNFNQLPGWDGNNLSIAALDTGTLSSGNNVTWSDNSTSFSFVIALAPSGGPRFRLRNAVSFDDGAPRLDVLVAVQRPNSTTINYSQNGSDPAAGAPVTNNVGSDGAPIRVAWGAAPGAGHYVRLISFGVSLTAAELSAYNTAAKDLMTAIDTFAFELDTFQLVAAMTVAPNEARRELINDTIVALKGNGVWAKNDLLYVMAAHDEQAARLNWKNPGANTLTPVNGPAFTIDNGFQGNGVNTKLLPGVTLAAIGSNYLQNSAHLAIWSRTNNTNNAGEIGGETNTIAQVRARLLSGEAAYRINAGTGGAVAVADSLGMYLGNRSAAAAEQLYKNGAFIFSDADASVPLTAAALEILVGNTLFTDRQVAFASAGGSLSAQEAYNYYLVMMAYMIEVGAETPTYEPEALSVFTAMTTQPGTARKTVINTLVAALKAADIWRKLDIMYVLAAHDEQAGRVNWKLPGTFTASLINAPVFTVDQGFIGNTAGSRLLSTGVSTLEIGGVPFGDDNAAIWSRTELSATNAVDLGEDGFTLRINSRNLAGVAEVQLRGSTTGSVTVPSSIGFLSMDRSGVTTAIDVYKNGVFVGSPFVSANVANGNHIAMLRGGVGGGAGGFGERQLAFMGMGSSSAGAITFTATTHAAYYAAVLAYLVSLGAA